MQHSGPVDFKTHFGPQDVSSSVEQQKLSEYRVRAQIVRGAKLRLLESENPTITCRAGRIVLGAPELSDDQAYLYLNLELQANTGWRIYDCALRLRGGVLEGAIVRVCVAEFAPPPSIRAPYQACYALPEGVRFEEGDVDWEVILFSGL